jgi:hypothetical protein
VAHELFEIQIKASINHSLQLIDILLDKDPTRARDSVIHEHVHMIRELVGLTRYVHPGTGERPYDDSAAQPNNAYHTKATEREQVEIAAYTKLRDQPS